ncbi:hypothetical protein BH09MYX1_BH09MYX1_17460 [soil metagenome]
MVRRAPTPSPNSDSFLVKVSGISNFPDCGRIIVSVVRRAVILAFALTACGGAAKSEPTDAGAPDAERVFHPEEAGARTDANTARFTYHGGATLTDMRVAFVYLDAEEQGGAPSFDSFADQLFVSSHWAGLSEYGIESGIRTTSIRVPRTDVLPPSSTDKDGLIDQPVFAEAVKSYLHGTTGPRFPDANAVVIFLPAGVNVVLGQRGSYKWRTCWNADAFHSTDGAGDPYIVIPPCASGRRTVALSHELGETATDPAAYTAWFSDADQFRSGGELADLCDTENANAFGFEIARYWSESKRRCVP